MLNTIPYTTNSIKRTRAVCAPKLNMGRFSVAPNAASSGGTDYSPGCEPGVASSLGLLSSREATHSPAPPEVLAARPRNVAFLLGPSAW